MRRGCGYYILIFLFLLIFSACSFKYRDDALLSDNAPEMVMENAKATRYEQSRKTVIFTAGTLEVYDADRVWAVESVKFIEYSDDGSDTVELEGTAGLLIIDDKAGVYSLGNTTNFFMREDGLRVSASDLRWEKKVHRLQSPENGMVEITKSDGSLVRGTGFFADTLSRSYIFKRSFSGVIVNEATDTDITGDR